MEIVKPIKNSKYVKIPRESCTGEGCDKLVKVTDRNKNYAKTCYDCFTKLHQPCESGSECAMLTKMSTPKLVKKPYKYCYGC